MKKLKYLLLVLLLGAAAPSAAQVPELLRNAEFRADAKAAVDSIYNFNFKGGEESLASWQEKYPEHPLWSLLEGMELWWNVLSDLEDTSRDEEFFEMMERIDYEARKLLYQNSSHADGLIIKAISNGYLARQHSNRSEWVTSLNYARKAMDAYDYLLEVQPELPDLKLAEGLKLYYSEYLPEAYPVVRTVSWFMPDGDKQKGLKLLQEASGEAIFAGAEARYFLGNINYNYEGNYDIAVRNFEELQSKYPDNNYYARLLVKSYYQQQRYDEAHDFIDHTLDRWAKQKLPFQKVLEEELLTWKGRILEKKASDDKALESYKAGFTRGQALPNTRSRSFHVAAGYLAGKILYEQEKYDEAKQVLNAVTSAKAGKEYQRRARELLSKMP